MMQIPAIQIHTIGQLLAPLGTTNPNQGLHVVSTIGNPAEMPILYPFRSDHFSFLIITKGVLQMKLNLLDYTIREENVLMLIPPVVRQFVSVSADCAATSVMFTPDYLSDAGIIHKNIDAFEFLSSMVNPLLIAKAEEMNILLTLLSLISAKLAPPSGQAYQEEVLKHIFAGFIYEIGSLYKKQEAINEVRGTRKEELTFRFLRLLPLHYKSERRVQAYAALLNITPKYLSQTVKEVSGKTAGDFIDEMVTIEAKILLNNLELTIAEVASYLNFSDQFFFSKYFKRQCGMSPSEYRKQA